MRLGALPACLSLRVAACQHRLGTPSIVLFDPAVDERPARSAMCGTSHMPLFTRGSLLVEELRYIVLGATGIQIYEKLKYSISKSPPSLVSRLLLTQIAAEFC